MKRFWFLFVLMLSVYIGYAQTTYFNDSNTVGDGKVGARLYSLEIRENGVIVTIELTAIKAQRRMDYWCTSNCYISSGNTKLLAVRGYWINNRIEPCGYDKQWGWSNVTAGTKMYYSLFFGTSSLPSGLTNISIIDEGTYYWNGYANVLVHSYSFRNYTINNPRKHYTNFQSEFAAKQNIDANNDGICGIYEMIGEEQNYKLACVKENGNYKLVYLFSSLGFSWWYAGDIKAYLNRSASGIFKADWFMTDKSINKDVYVAFDGVSMVVKHMSGPASGESNYLKMYPANSSSIAGGTGGNQDEKWTGTGFALRNGYIVTNHHVIDGAKSMTVAGVNGDFSIDYKAKVVAIDKNNDLALIKIEDYRFKGFASVPYAVKNRICEVGEEVFVLGYPLTNYMGEEVKLTNGIISSRTGYQGDVSTYQISAPVQPGNSGGPMFDSRGNIVGIVNAGIPGAENVGYAIKTSYLFNLVSSVTSTSIIPQTNQVTGVKLADKVRSVKNNVFYIKCNRN